MAWWMLWAVAPDAGATDLVEAAVTALRQDRLAVAEAWLLEAAEADEGNVEAWWALGWARYTAGRFAQAQTAWDRVAQLQPDRPEIELWRSAAATRARWQIDPGPLPEVDLTPTGPTIRIVAGGDTMMGSDLVSADRLPAGAGDALFDEVRPILTGADLAFVNLEGPLADGIGSRKCGAGSTSCYAFRTPSRFAATLVRAGIDAVSLANNHAFDLGAAGQEATMSALDGVGIAHAGRYGDVASIEASGLTVAVVAAHSGTCCLSVNHLDEVRSAIAEADRDHDLVILSFHGGAEGADHRHVPGRMEIAWGEQRGDVAALAHAAIDAGADLVFGHGPHVLRGMEVYRGRLVAYSLGNFVGYRAFGRAGGYGRRTVLLDVEVASNGAVVSGRIWPLALDRDAVPHLDPGGPALQDIAGLSAADFPDTGVGVGPDGTLILP